MDDFVEHFRNEVRRVSIYGVNGEDQDVPYVPYSALKDYWTEERVTDILNCPTPPIIIFSTLVYRGFCDKILWFFRNTRNLDDHNLPFDEQVFEPTADWPRLFLEDQWMFCAADLANRQYHKRVVGSKFILPVTEGEDIRATRTAPDGAILRKYQFRRHSTSNTAKGEYVVFKVYEGHDGEVRYNAETDVYMKLHNHSSNCIVKHIASFEFREIMKFVIILEYAEGGSLLDYLRTTRLPVRPEDFYSLWEGLFELLDALYLLGNIYRQNRNEPKTLVGLHQDIHLGNILVFPKGEARSPFNAQFKLTDFGLARMGRVSHVDGRLSTRDRGNRTYIAPEVFPNFGVQDSCDTPISPQADIWSLGALFSDVLVWTIVGEDGREDYRRRRKEEIQQCLHLRSAGFDCCFHDSERRLKAVDDQHNEVLQDKRERDTLSPRISELILHHMLVGSRERLEAMELRKYTARMLLEDQNHDTATVASSNSTLPPVITANTTTHNSVQQFELGRRATTPANGFNGNPHPARGLPPQPLVNEPTRWHVATTDQQNEQLRLNRQLYRSYTSTWRVVTVKEVYKIIDDKNRRFHISRFLGTVPNKSDEIMDLPGMREARSKISENDGRDQILLFDDFGSMHEHKKKAMKTARVISYVAKEADNDGMEVYAASRTAQGPIICKTSSDVESAIGKFKTVEGTCNLRKCLEDILKRVLKEHNFKPTSIYIFTDGIWEPGDDQVKAVIRKAIKFLIKHQLPSSALMFQFVQFGSNPEGELRMKKLDDDCKVETEDELYDIVDHKHCDSHVPYIVIGSISPHNDEMEARVENTLSLQLWRSSGRYPGPHYPCQWRGTSGKPHDTSLSKTVQPPIQANLNQTMTS
ncbi:hypothetical protein FOXB_11953 [Fusarium oxysporum f. sp. conglutinans Fo5176]|uniref:Protein kinase domain-containing protein n=1 Tax=Fusarium oxysporum (strain Fo5176) TaxID=660025 RepID=F9FZX1_FUSOF|nr:hypothetical protein FOXB_11953 [Fusarium oxysporum f. sp. conglutinans Fo5176]